MQVKSRHHLRSDEIQRIETRLEETLGVVPDSDSYERVEFADSDIDLVLVDGDPLIAYFENDADSSSSDSYEPFLTVSGANAYPPRRRVVTVDAGAISFVSDGADVMRPGITEADDTIEPGDLVVIAEETHGKILAIGRARADGNEMTGNSGKVVDSIHHVGDELYQVKI
jgi:PUA-domain protein